MEAGSLDALVCSKFVELLYLLSVSQLILVKTVDCYLLGDSASKCALATVCCCLSLLQVAHNQLLYNIRLWLKGNVSKSVGFWLFDVYNLVFLRKKIGESASSVAMRFFQENLI
jgi:hypothetical protein